jgi:enterochelin esterase-like enzyme
MGRVSEDEVSVMTHDAEPTGGRRGASAPVRRHPPKTRRPTPAPVVASPAITALEARIAELRAHPDGVHTPQTLVDAFRAEHASSPIIEPDPAGVPGLRVVTFALHDPAAERVLLFVNRLTDETDLDRSLMRRVPDTDLWHLSYRMPDDWIASYSYSVQRPGHPAPWEGQPDQRGVRDALDHGLADPRNPSQITNRAGVRISVAALPHAPAEPWRAVRDDVPQGRLTAHAGPDGRRLWIYEPAAGDHGAVAPAPTPVLVVLDGDVWCDAQPLPTILDNMIADAAIPPVTAVFVDSADRERRWAELDAHGGIVDWLADRLRPWLVARLGGAIDLAPRRVVVAGQSLGGLAALAAVVRRPDAFGGAIAQSAALWQPDVAREAAACPPRGARIDLQVGLQEWVLLEPTRDLAAQLADDGVDVVLTEVDGGHDYAWWRRTLPTALRRQLAEPQDAEADPA